MHAYYRMLFNAVKGEGVTPLQRYYGDNFVVDETLWHGEILDGSVFLCDGKKGKVSFDVEARLAAFAKTFNEVTFANEAQMRMALKVYLDTWLGRREGAATPPVREGRRMRWLDTVLQPAKKGLPKKQWRRLQAALALTVGTDALVIMKDVCRMDDAEAQEVLLWASQTLLRGALQPSAVKSTRSKAAAPRRLKSA